MRVPVSAAIILIVSPMLAQLMASHVPPEHQRPRGYVPPQFDLFPSIGENEFAEWKNRLALSQAQRAAAMRLFESYQSQVADLTPEVERLSDSAWRLSGPLARDLETRERLRGLEQLLSESAALRRHMIEVEDGFLLGISEFLAEEQKTALFRIELARERVRYAVRREALPGAAVDLVSLVGALELHDEPEGEAVRDIIAEYEVHLVALLKRRFDAALSYLLRGARHETEAEAAGRFSDSRFVDERRAIFRARLQADTRLRALNHATLAALSRLLSADGSRRVIDVVDAATYPTVYPDSNIERARSILSRTAEFISPDETRLDAIRTIERMFEVEYDRLRRWHDEEVLRFQAGFQATKTLSADDRSAHETTLKEIRELRRELAERTIVSAQLLLTEEEREALTAEPASEVVGSLEQ